MKQVLVCKKCGEDLSKPVIIYREKHGKLKSKKGRVRVPPPDGCDLPTVVLYYNCEEAIMPEGCVLETKNILYDRIGHPLCFKPQFYLTLEDILPTVGKNKHWAQQCCGAGISDYPNRQCKCGSAVGFELSECFTEHVFIPDNEKTKWKNVK